MPEIRGESARAIDALIKSAATARAKNGDFTANSGLIDYRVPALTAVWRRRLNAQSLEREGRGMIHAAGFGKTLLSCAVLGLYMLLTPPARAAAPPEVHPAAAPHALIKEDLEAFFDGIIPLQLERSDVAGATVLVMRGGETLLLKGYGSSDLKAARFVDPEATMF